MNFRFLEIVIRGFDDPYNIQTALVDSMLHHVTRILEKDNTVHNMRLADCILRDAAQEYIDELTQIMWEKLLESCGSDSLPHKLEKAIKVDFKALSVKKQDTLFFAPFLGSTIFTCAFLIQHFRAPGLLERYWTAHEGITCDFFRDICYFANLWFDPTLKKLFPYENIIESIQSTLDEIDVDRRTLLRNEQPRTSSADGDDDDGDMSIVSGDSIRSSQSGSSRRGKGINKSDHFLEKYCMFISRIRTNVPLSCIRPGSTISMKLRWLVTKIPYMVETNDTEMKFMMDIIDREYHPLTIRLSINNTESVHGLIVCAQFITEVHLDMISNKIHEKLIAEENKIDPLSIVDDDQE